MICCPEAYPRFRGGRCLADANRTEGGGPYGGPYEPSSDSGACDAGGRSTCVVVGLDLPSNSLKGELDEGTLCSLVDARLTYLNVEDNQLSGLLPSCLDELDSVVHLSGNTFRYTESSADMRRLVKMCRDGATDCAGVPPLGCSAFGPLWEVRSDDSERCVKCFPPALSWTLQALLLVCFVLLVYGYVRLVAAYQRRAEKLDLWINTAAIFFCHLQTLSIVATLQLAWPPSVEAITEIASVDFLSVGAVRPECSLDLGENSYYVVTLFHMLLLLTLLLSVSALQSAVKRCPTFFANWHPNGSVVVAVDQLEMVETVLFTCSFTLSWRVIFDFWGTQAASRRGIANAGTALASLLFVVQLVLLFKYAVNIRALVTGRSFGKLARLGVERLRLRLSFLTERFGAHAPYWAFVVWGRQFILALDAWIATRIIDATDDVKTGVAVCDLLNSTAAGAAAADGTAADGAGGNATGMGMDMDEQPGCKPLSARSLEAIWTQAAIAMLTLLVFGALHLRTQPYPFRFQNDIETFLFAANFALVGFGTLYTALKVRGDESVGVEAMCVLLLLGSLGGAAAFIVRKSRAAHLARRQELATKASDVALGFDSRGAASASPRAAEGGAGAGGGKEGLGLGPSDDGAPRRSKNLAAARKQVRIRADGQLASARDLVKGARRLSGSLGSLRLSAGLGAVIGPRSTGSEASRATGSRGSDAFFERSGAGIGGAGRRSVNSPKGPADEGTNLCANPRCDLTDAALRLSRPLEDRVPGLASAQL